MIVGLTGGIGSGKSTVSKLFAQLGVPIIDADKIAHDLVKPQQPALALIEKKLGATYLNEDGTLNRAKLRKAVFDDSELKKKLETIMHPMIRESIMRQVSGHKAPYCMVVIPLLIEHHAAYRWVHRILVVDAPMDLQIKRTSKRDEVSVEQAKKIIAQQATREERLKLADDVIENTQEDLEELTKHVHDLHQRYLEYAKNYG